MNPFDFAGRLELLRLRMGDPAMHSVHPCLEDPEVTARRLLAQGSAPKRHRKTTIISYNVWDQRFRRLREPLGSGKVLALLGPRFCGKTQLAVELMRDRARQGRPVLYRTATELFQLFKDTFHEAGDSSGADLHADHRRPAFLVIDEINTPLTSPWQRLLLFEVINQRFGDLNDTLLVSPLPQDQFITAVGDPVVSRIRKAGLLVVLGA